MNKFLNTYLSKPLEREYEAWVVYGIQDYFEQIGIKSYIWAVSPFEEVHWPADEHLFMKGKIVGLQFKQAKIDLSQSNKQADFSRLKWTFHNPAGQFQLIQTHPEIYYCLPTFIDRRLSRFALQHCLFWRPEVVIDYNAWYKNHRAFTHYNSIHSSSRWGHFVEQIIACQIGKKLESLLECQQYLTNLYSTLREPIGEATTETNLDGFYLIYIQFL